MTAPTSDKAAIRQTVRVLRDAGWMPDSVNDGEEDVKVSNETETVAAVMAVDDAFLFVLKDGEQGWVRFVLGNDPDEVICNHTLNLSEQLDPLTDGWFS